MGEGERDREGQGEISGSVQGAAVLAPAHTSAHVCAPTQALHLESPPGGVEYFVSSHKYNGWSKETGDAKARKCSLT